MGWIILSLLFRIAVPEVMASSVTISIEEDTYVEENFADTAPWNNRNLYLGTDTWYSKGKTRILIKPDFQELRNLNILVTDITSVSLELSLYSSESSRSQVTVDAYTTTSPWSMFEATWNSQPSITSKKDSSIISPTNGRKSIQVTNAFINAFSDKTTERGIILKMNPENDKAIIFWAHGCDIAPDEPKCSEPAERPSFKIQLKDNSLPTTCSLRAEYLKSITNDTSITLQANVSSDSNGDTVTYVGRICTDPACSAIYWESPISSSTKTTIPVPDGEYYLSCKASDGHTSEDWSSLFTSVIDTTIPNAPTIIEEPLFTASTDNVIAWYPENEPLEYQVLSSERSDFRSYNTYSVWTKENSIHLLHSKEKQFFYKVHARDLAGNISEWSTITSTIIDKTYPTITYFKTNKTLLSPKLNSDQTIDNTAYIQGGVDDDNILSLLLEIKDSSGRVAKESKVLGKSYLWTHWPDNPDYPDGTYTAQLTAEDNASHIILSDPLFITLDTQPPLLPVIVGVRDGITLSSKKISFSVSCTALDKATVLVSGKTVASGKAQHTITLQKNDGTYTVSATCTDSAGNKSQKSLKFSIDTTPPATPALSYDYDKEKKILTLKMYCREDARSELFVNGVHLANGTCKKNGYYTFVQNLKDLLPLYATYTGRLADQSGNWSQLSDKTVYLSAETSTAPKNEKITCSAVYLLSQNQYRAISCNWPENAGLNYITTEQIDTKTYASELNALSGKPAVITISVIACKQRSLWDPRTWFACVEEFRETVNTTATLQPIYSGVLNKDATTIIATHPKIDEVRIKYKYYVYFSVQVGTNMTVGSQLTTENEFRFVPRYTHQFGNGYLSWLFENNSIQVSQWYGNTAFQKPHSGIDFSVSRAKIKSPAPGKVVAAGYYKKNNCNSGGYYVGLKHPNGLFTYYFHLASIKNLLTGKNLTIGMSIDRGRLFLQSGNSGLFNCERLDFHLHFEVRKSQALSTHINPVPFFSINWNLIKTANIFRFPQRLSGQNPHPKF